MASIGFVAGGVIWLAAFLQKHAALGPAIACFAVAVLLDVACFALLLRRPGFAWWRFKQVFFWVFLANLIVSGMIVYAFIYDQTRGATLALLILLLAVYVVSIALIPAFTVARYESPYE